MPVGITTEFDEAVKVCCNLSPYGESVNDEFEYIDALIVVS